MSGIKKWLIALTSFIFALGLWIAVTLTQVHQRTIIVPFELKNVSNEFALSKPIPKNIFLTIKGTGWDLFFYQLTQGIAYRVDVKDLPKNFSFNSLKNIYHYLKISENFQIISINPETINLSFENKSSKTVPIKLNILQMYKTGYNKIGEVKVIPESVIVSGAPSILKDLHYWETETKSFKNISNDIYSVLKLKDTLSFSITRSLLNVEVSWKVEAVAEKSINNIPIAFINFPKNFSIRTVPPSINILVKGPNELISKLKESEIIAEIDYQKIKNDTTGFASPTINLPKEIELKNISPNRIQYFRRKIK